MPVGYPALLLGGFATSEGVSPLKIFEQWQNQDWLIHHDNALVRTALSVGQYLATKNMAVSPHPTLTHLIVIPCCF
jgi:hypothetical protein